MTFGGTPLHAQYINNTMSIMIWLAGEITVGSPAGIPALRGTENINLLSYEMEWLTFYIEKTSS